MAPPGVKRRRPDAKLLVKKAKQISDPLATHSELRKCGPDGVYHLQFLSASQADAATKAEVFALLETNMRTFYEQTPSGWDAAGKQTELWEESARYLLMRREGRLVGFVHFRYDLDDDGRLPIIYCYELQLAAECRGLGLGRQLLRVLDILGVDAAMRKTVLTVQKVNKAALGFYQAQGFKLDDTDPGLCDPAEAHTVHYVIMSRPCVH
eukprot:comp59202_c0_seq1/m.47846 comp59202_c0_seq1/g.47846  ORF comp59202_c0_seq1/g.47846 comp59202_c0_seq1/m.47846 type:complete len:209 (-) comp59202_c0_seq1:255-881(-)